MLIWIITIESRYLVKIGKCILIACHIDSHSHLCNVGGEKKQFYFVVKFTRNAKLEDKDNQNFYLSCEM